MVRHDDQLCEMPSKLPRPPRVDAVPRRVRAPPGVAAAAATRSSCAPSAAGSRRGALPGDSAGGRRHPRADPRRDPSRRHPEDRAKISTLQRAAEEAVTPPATRLIAQHQLPMELVDVEHLFGGERIVFYFLAEKRVDFRELVKDLAREFHTRIECGRSASATRPSCSPTTATAASRSAATRTWPSCRRCRCGWPSCRNRRSTRRRFPAAAAG